jgi:hypothetical protein
MIVRLIVCICDEKWSIYRLDRAEEWNHGKLRSGDSRKIQAQSGTTYITREGSSIYYQPLLPSTAFYVLLLL